METFTGLRWFQKYSGKSCRESKTNILFTVTLHKTWAFSIIFLKTQYTKCNENSDSALLRDHIQTEGSMEVASHTILFVCTSCSTSKTQAVQCLQPTEFQEHGKRNERQVRPLHVHTQKYVITYLVISSSSLQGSAAQNFTPKYKVNGSVPATGKHFENLMMRTITNYDQQESLKNYTFL